LGTCPISFTGSMQSGIVACSGGTDVNAVCDGLTSPVGPRLNASGSFEDLPAFGVSLTQQAAVTTTAAPEPGTMVLLATGLALVLTGATQIRRTCSRIDRSRSFL
jgi:hypothetical protein